MRLRQLLKRTILNRKFLRRPAIAYCTYHALLPSVFTRTPSQKLRELLFLPVSRYDTQLNQDVFALLVNRFRPGYFIEIGANDGFTFSNTLILEEHFAWDGLLIEANPEYFESLRRRRARKVMSAVVAAEGTYEFVSAGLYGGIAELLDGTHEARRVGARSIAVRGLTLEQILRDNGAPETIDFISIDVEGGELPIIEHMCRLQNFRFRCGCIEYNARQKDYDRMTALLKGAGYREVWRGQTYQDLFFIDDGS